MNDFLSLLFNPEDNIEIRTTNPAESYCGRLNDPQLMAFTEQHNGKRNVYFGANPRREGVAGAARAADVKHRSAVFFDLDDKDGDHSATLASLKALHPHAIVMTGHGHHVWFRIQPEPPETNKSRLEMALTMYGSDAVGDAPRIARLPGTLNLKADPVRAELVHTEPEAQVRALGKLLDALGVPAYATATTAATRRPAPSLDAWVQGLDYLSEASGPDLEYDGWLPGALALVGAAAEQPWEPEAREAFVARDTDTGGKDGLTFWKSKLKSAGTGWLQVCQGNAMLAFTGIPVPPLPAGVAVSPAQTGTANRFAEAMVQLGDIKPSLTTRYLVKGWLDAGTLSVVYGESNVGKSFLTLDMALHIAAGGCDWNGSRLAENAGPVVYIAAEGGFGIRNRLAAFRSANPQMAACANQSFTLLPVAVDLYGHGDIDDLIDALPQQASLICTAPGF